MRFIQEFGFCVKRGKGQDFQRWLIDNEEAFAAAHPEGTQYLGTFATIYHSEKHSGELRTFVELDSHAAQDRLAEVSKDPHTEFGRLNREFCAFIDIDHAEDWSNGLHKAVVDATMWDPPAP